MSEARTPLNVLVLGVGGNVGQSIQKALALAETPTRIVAACIGATSAGLYMADVGYISPLADAPEFVPWLLELCERERIDAVMSGSEVVLGALAAAAGEIRERTGAFCVVSSPAVLAIGRDKLRTCEWLQRAGLPVPGFADCADPQAVRSLVESCGFPLIAKPRLGKGGDYILTIRDEDDLAGVALTTDVLVHDEHRGNVRGPRDLLLQEHLGDDQKEYTAGCFCDADGELRGTIVMRRTLRAGTTVTAELGRFPEVRDAATAIVSALQPLGPCNVQLRMHQGHATPFEINPRFSGTTALRARMGFNEADACLRHFVLGEPAIDLRGAEDGIALRYWNEVYVPRSDFDEFERTRKLEARAQREVRVESWGHDR